MEKSQVVVRQVWGYNLNNKFGYILQSLCQFPYVSIDTEFPGTIFNINIDMLSSLTPSDFYFNMKKNVDVLHLIQLGFTLSDVQGRLPRLGSNQFQYVWQFNFCEFDCQRDLQNTDSVALLRQQGTDFSQNKSMGVRYDDFAYLFKTSILGRSSLLAHAWITFHGMYDLGFLIKILTGRQLPGNLEFFMALVQVYLGLAVYDLKPMAQVLGLHGGLERIAQNLDLRRIVGRRHQAGSDSLLAMQVFIELKRRNWISQSMMDSFNGQVYGLTWVRPMAFPGNAEPPARLSHVVEPPTTLSHVDSECATELTHIDTDQTECRLRPSHIDRKNDHKDKKTDEAVKKKENDPREGDMRKE